MLDDGLLHKIHAQGNDFIIIPQKRYHEFGDLSARQLLAHRRYGIGADQLFFIDINIKQATWSASIFNQDGHSASFCLNGLYACACYIHKQHPHIKQWQIVLGKQQYNATINNNEVFIDVPKTYTSSTCTIDKSTITPEVVGTIINIGNQHLLINKDSYPHIRLTKIGKQLQQHPLFPDGINLSFYQKKNISSIQIQTYERGCGLTFSCGSAGLATALLNWQQYPETKKISIHHPGGESTYTRNHDKISMQGQYNYVASFNYTSHPYPEKFQALPANAPEIVDQQTE